MAGRVIGSPKLVHSCDPGWEWREPGPDALPHLPAGTRYGVPPDPFRFPVGTLWCCECGQVWVSMGSPAINLPGVCVWRREGWLARWWRERRG